MGFLEKLSKIKDSTSKQVIDIANKINWKSPKTIGSLAITLTLVSGLSFYALTTTSVSAVTINGQHLGYVESPEEGDAVLAEYLEKMGQPYGVLPQTRDQIDYEKVRIKKSDFQDSRLDEKTIAGMLNFYIEGVKVTVDGTTIAYLPTQEKAEQLLKEFQEFYAKSSESNQVTSVDFAEEVKIEKASLQPEQISTVEEAYETLIKGKVTTKEYVVEENDSWWLIARKNNMFTDEVLAGNPGTTEDTIIQPGQVINLVSVTPYLTVISQGTYSGEEIIPYDVVTKTDTKLRPGQSKVVTKGSNGKKLVTYSYEQRNGVEVKKEVLNEEILEKPVDEVVAKGPKRRTVVASASTPSRGSANGGSIVDRALSFVGTKYVYGGSSASGFDCSGFTKYVYAGSGISLPRTSYAQFNSGTKVSKNNLQPGDLVFFSTYAAGASHVGIYIGGGRFVHASNPSSGVKINGINDSFYGPRYLGARRY
ncbi:MAG: LysM peptidoglycan-binding domain-containing protein [Desulfitobacterium sp.]|nr:LysM peptidoglycan-binding domain-containing protein [Desulfitobacterium sp.]